MTGRTGLTVKDLFCGAGGSSTGMVAAGVRVVLAANHSPLAVSSHQANHPETDHDCADISQVDFRRYPPTDLLWVSPECTHQSKASGKKRASGQLALYGDDPAGDPAAVRSRATMFDVLRAVEVGRLRGRPYLGGVVENVVETADWMFFDLWRAGFDAAGYEHEIVSLNSMYARDEPDEVEPAPQSRDRMYVVFWLRSLGRRPDLAFPQPGWCPRCDDQVDAVQVWKRADRQVGRYRQQYLYRCPRPRCAAVVDPPARPAADAIDWTLPGRKIGGRKKPLAESTLARIRAGVARYDGPVLVPAGGTWRTSAAPVGEPFATRTTRAADGLVVPPFLVKLRGGSDRGRGYSLGAPLGTVSAGGQHHGLVTPAGFGIPDTLLMSYYGNGGMTSTGRPVPTCTTKARHALLAGLHSAGGNIDDYLFRMLAVREVQAAMAFPADYRLYGNQEEQILQLGQAVTPPSATVLISRLVDAIIGTGR